MLEAALTPKPPTVAVLDFGGQYAHLIARRLRALGVFAALYPPETFHPEAHPEVVGIVLSGGPDSVCGVDGAPPLQFDLLACRVPVLGLCFGHQLIAQTLGGVVASGGATEYGLTEVQCDPTALLFRGMSPQQSVWMSHGDHVQVVPPGFVVTASTPRSPVAAFEHRERALFGLQFHPEVTHTRCGTLMLGNFLAACRAPRTWNAGEATERLVAQVRARAGDRPLFLLLSGGVDSLVCLALCVRALGPDRVYSLHVDTGFMRLGESQDIAAAVRALGFQHLTVVASERLFLERLEGVTDPETKRAIIGALFVEVLHEEIGRLPLGDDWLLVQGTIYPDRIESGGTKKAARIKTHHNRVPEIERMIAQGKVLEPLEDLYKDEVREVGRQLGLPASLVDRHPFPGPGLAIRVLASRGEVPAGFDADEPLVQELARGFELRGRVLPVNSVGVQGDSRTYRHPAVIWTDDGRWPGWTEVKACAAALVNRVGSVNRVLWAVRPPTGLTLAPCLLEKPVIDRLRRVDAVVRQGTAPFSDIWQIPVVALPLFDAQGRQAFVVRPVCSQDAMTAEVFELDPQVWQQIIEEAGALDGVGPLFYDLTTKPPATIEWE